jgi:hypothetical protein
VLDTGALIAFERNGRRVRTLVEHAPAGVIAQAWRDGRTQARIVRVLGSGAVSITALDADEARAVGVLCRETGASDIVDASVVLLARRHSARVVTSNPDDIRRIDSSLDLVDDMPAAVSRLPEGGEPQRLGSRPPFPPYRHMIPFIQTETRLPKTAVPHTKRAVVTTRRRVRGDRTGWVRKNVVMDQRKLDVARRALGVETETEAIDQALDLVSFREELAKGFAAVRRSGGVEDVLARRRNA